MSEGNGYANLTAADLVEGSNEFTPVDLPEFIKDGKPGRVWLKDPSTQAILELSNHPEESDAREAAVFCLVTESVVDHETGELLLKDMTLDQVQGMGIATFKRITDAVVKSSGLSADEIKNVSSETPITVSPTQ